FHGRRLAIQVSSEGASGPVAASWNTISQTRPISIRPQNNTTNHTLDGPALTLTGVRLTALTVKSLFLRTLDLGISTSGITSELRCSGRHVQDERNAPTSSERRVDGQTHHPAVPRTQGWSRGGLASVPVAGGRPGCLSIGRLAAWRYTRGVPWRRDPPQRRAAARRPGAWRA